MLTRPVMPLWWRPRVCPANPVLEAWALASAANIVSTNGSFWYPGFVYDPNAPAPEWAVPPALPPRRCTCGSVVVFGPGGAGHSDWCDLATGGVR